MKPSIINFTELQPDMQQFYEMYESQNLRLVIQLSWERLCIDGSHFPCSLEELLNGFLGKEKRE